MVNLNWYNKNICSTMQLRVRALGCTMYPEVVVSNPTIAGQLNIRGMVQSGAARLLWEQKVIGSTPITPIKITFMMIILGMT